MSKQKKDKLVGRLGLKPKLVFPVSDRVDCTFTIQAIKASTGTPQFELLFTYEKGKGKDKQSATYTFWVAISKNTSGILKRYLGEAVGLPEDQKLDEQQWLELHTYIKNEETRELDEDEEREVFGGSATIKVEYDTDEKRNNLVYFDQMNNEVEETLEEMNNEVEANNEETEDGTVPF